MSRLALLFKQFGVEITGSDRFYPQQLEHPLISRLLKEGIVLSPQDGSGITSNITRVVASAAVEDNNPDMIKARALSLPVVSRSTLLAEIFNKNAGFGISGTSGKTTTTGMVSTVLRYLNKPHLFYSGDDLKDELSLPRITPNALPLPMVAEVDESDGSPVLYHSRSVLITNVSLDHKETSFVMDIFEKFCNHASEYVVLNADCPYCRQLKDKIPDKTIITFGIKNTADFQAEKISSSEKGSSFVCNGVEFTIQVPGAHNIYNALGTIALLAKSNLTLEDIRAGLSQFKGMKRRLELVAEQSEIRIYDDFSHNPDKIYAALTTVKRDRARVFLIFKPHGYNPMILFRKEFIDALCSALTTEDFIFLLDIFDAGGTANRTIHSKDLIDDLQKRGMNARYIHDPDSIPAIIQPELKQNDTVIVMGARDPYLSIFAQTLADKLLPVHDKGACAL